MTVLQNLISAEVGVVGEEEPDELTFEEVVHELLHSRVTCWDLAHGPAQLVQAVKCFDHLEHSRV